MSRSTGYETSGVDGDFLFPRFAVTLHPSTGLYCLFIFSNLVLVGTTLGIGTT